MRVELQSTLTVLSKALHVEVHKLALANVLGGPIGGLLLVCEETFSSSDFVEFLRPLWMLVHLLGNRVPLAAEPHFEAPMDNDIIVVASFFDTFGRCRWTEPSPGLCVAIFPLRAVLFAEFFLLG